MYGNKLADRIRPPKWETVEDEDDPKKKTKLPVYSSAIEDFYFNVDALQKKKKPFIYILDSMDSLTSTQADQYFEENIKQRETQFEKGKEEKLKQGMGDGKAKYNSQHLRKIVYKLRETGSILIILCQLRENFDEYGEKWVRAGGRALKFYAHQELWLFHNNKKALKRTINGNEYTYGTTTKADIRKNRITGMRPDVEFQILTGAGISDVDTCLDWLVTEKRVTPPPKGGKAYTYDKMNLSCSREKFIAEMENNFEPFKEEISRTWYQILKAISSTRRKKYI